MDNYELSHCPYCGLELEETGEEEYRCACGYQLVGISEEETEADPVLCYCTSCEGVFRIVRWAALEVGECECGGTYELYEPLKVEG